MRFGILHGGNALFRLASSRTRGGGSQAGRVTPTRTRHNTQSGSKLKGERKRRASVWSPGTNFAFLTTIDRMASAFTSENEALHRGIATNQAKIYIDASILLSVLRAELAFCQTRMPAQMKKHGRRRHARVRLPSIRLGNPMRMQHAWEQHKSISKNSCIFGEFSTPSILKYMSFQTRTLN